MYGVLHADNITHTVNLIPLKELDNIPVFVEPLDPYKLCGVRVFYVTVGDMHVSLYDAVLFPPVAGVRRRTRGGRCPGRMTSALCGVRFLPRGGRRQPRSGQHTDPGSRKAVERGRRLIDAEAGSGLRDLRQAGGEQLFNRFVAVDVCSQTHNAVTNSDASHRAGA